ncbi:MAG: hypothetical protein ACLSAH_12800 [Bilophila wadsworthia]
MAGRAAGLDICKIVAPVVVKPDAASNRIVTEAVDATAARPRSSPRSSRCPPRRTIAQVRFRASANGWYTPARARRPP